MSDQGDPFWGNDPRILVQPEAALELLPSGVMTHAERYNAVARVIILISLGLSLLTRKLWPLGFGIAALAIDWIAHAQTAPPTQVSAPVQSGRKRKHKRRHRDRSQALFPPLTQPVIGSAAADAIAQQRLEQQQSQQQAAGSTDEWAPHVRADGSIVREDPQAPQDSQPSQSSPDLWRQFVAGPGGNMVNDGHSALEQRGVADSHGHAAAEGFSDGPAPYEGPVTPNVGFSLDGADPLGGCAVPDLQASAVPSSFESKRLPKQGERSAAQQSDPFWGTNESSRHQEGSFLGASEQKPWMNWEDEAKMRQEYDAMKARQQGQAQQQPQQQQQQPQPYHAPGQAPPVCKPFEQMTESEKHNFVAREKRDNFLNRLFQDIDEPMNEYQFFTLPNYNELEDRDRAMDGLYGKDSLGYTNFKDKHMTWQQKYFD